MIGYYVGMGELNRMLIADHEERWYSMFGLGLAYCPVVHEYLSASHLDHGIDCCSCHSTGANDKAGGARWLNGVSGRYVTSEAGHLEDFD